MIKMPSKIRDWKEVTEIKTDEKKQREMILLIAEGMSKQPNFGKTVLAKMMYFSETNNFLKTGDTICGTVFIRKEHGPLPVNFDELLKKMEADGLIKVVKVTNINSPDRYMIIPKRSPNLSVFNESEVEIIKSVISKLNFMSAGKIREYSHTDLAWRWSKPNEEIDIRLSAYRDIEQM